MENRNNKKTQLLHNFLFNKKCVKCPQFVYYIKFKFSYGVTAICGKNG